MTDVHSKQSAGIIKEMAVDFLQLVIAGKIDAAYEKYVDMKGSHHNSYFPAGFSALKEAMKENHDQFPNKGFDVEHVISENNMVAVHSRLSMGEQQLMVVHLFRFENGKILEMWDIAQEIPIK